MTTDRESLLSAVVQSPDDVELRLVYADAASVQNDPHGELIAVQHELSKKKATWAERLTPRIERLALRERELITIVAGAIGLPAEALEFKNGFVRTLKSGSFNPKALDQATLHPAMRLVDGLSVAFRRADATLACLRSTLGPNIRRLLGDVDGEVLEPAIEATGGRIDHLEIRAGSLHHAIALRPALKKLSILDDWAFDTDRNIEILLDTVPFTTLRHLSVGTRSDRTANILRRLADSPLELDTLQVRLNGAADAFRELATTAIAERFRKMRFEPFEAHPRYGVPEIEAVARAYLVLGRPADALPLFEEVYQFSNSREARAGYEEASRLTNNRRDPDDPDPERDRLAERVPRLFAWSLTTRDGGRAALADHVLDRLLAAAPDHAGAWFERACVCLLRDESAVYPLSRALATEPTLDAPDPIAFERIAFAYANLAIDPQASVDALSGSFDGDHCMIHAMIAKAFACVAIDKMEDGIAALDELEAHAVSPRAFALSWLARGILERVRGDEAAARACWRRLSPAGITPPEVTAAIAETAGTTLEATPHDHAVCGLVSIFATVLRSRAGSTAESQSRRHAWGLWFTGLLLRPMSTLVFLPLLAAAVHKSPDLELTQVLEPIDQLMGMPPWGWRARKEDVRLRRLW